MLTNALSIRARNARKRRRVRTARTGEQAAAETEELAWPPTTTRITSRTSRKWFRPRPIAINTPRHSVSPSRKPCSTETSPIRDPSLARRLEEEGLSVRSLNRTRSKDTSKPKRSSSSSSNNSSSNKGSKLSTSCGRGGIYWDTWAAGAHPTSLATVMSYLQQV